MDLLQFQKAVVTQCNMAFFIFSASQGTPGILRSTKVQYSVKNSPPLMPILSQMSLFSRKVLVILLYFKLIKRGYYWQKLITLFGILNISWLQSVQQTDAVKSLFKNNITVVEVYYVRKIFIQFVAMRNVYVFCGRWSFTKATLVFTY